MSGPVRGVVHQSHRFRLGNEPFHGARRLEGHGIDGKIGACACGLDLPDEPVSVLNGLFDLGTKRSGVKFTLVSVEKSAFTVNTSAS